MGSAFNFMLEIITPEIFSNVQYSVSIFRFLIDYLKIIQRKDGVIHTITICKYNLDLLFLAVVILNLLTCSFVIIFSLCKQSNELHRSAKRSSNTFPLVQVTFSCSKSARETVEEKYIYISNNQMSVSYSVRKVRIWSHLLKKSLMENFIFLCSASP